MTTIKLLGRVYPAGFNVNLHAPNVSYKADDGTLDAQIDIRSINSELTVTWSLEKYDASTLMAIWTHSKKLSTVLVDLIAFREGAAAVVVIDHWINESGERNTLALVEPAVAKIATSVIGDEGLLAVFGLVANEQQLLVVLEDLIATLMSQEHKTINCARCVEAVRQLIAGYHLEPKEQWPLMHTALHVDRSYLDVIMNESKNPRHGKQLQTAPNVVSNIIQRTWTLIDRFFHYRIAGSIPLTEPKFPLLKA